MSEYLISIFTLIFIYVVIVLSLNLAVGFTGLVNLGHMVFFGIGAYASAILTINGVPWHIAMIIAAVIASIVGMVIAAVTTRLKGEYFAMVTLSLVFLAIAVSRNWVSITRGALGIPGIPSIIKNNFYYMLFTFGVMALVIIIFYRIVNSETGRIFQAIRDDETAASVLGKNTYFYKIISIGISTFFAGIAGSLFVHQINFIDPTIFDIEFFVVIISMLIAGGLASIKGSVIGVSALFIISESLRFLQVSPSLIGPMRSMVFVVAILFILLFRPRGIFGKVDV